MCEGEEAGARLRQQRGERKAELSSKRNTLRFASFVLCATFHLQPFFNYVSTIISVYFAGVPGVIATVDVIFALQKKHLSLLSKCRLMHFRQDE